MTTQKKTQEKKVEAPKVISPDKAYGTTFYASFGGTNNEETNGKPAHIYGARAVNFRGKAIVIINRSKSRTSGKGKKLLDYILNGKTYEELQTRLATDRKNGSAPIYETNIGHHLDWDVTHGATKLVAYYDSKAGTIITPVPEEIREAREASKLPALDS